MNEPDLCGVADVFDVLKRFHVYDHRNDEWTMSGVDLAGDGCIVEHFMDGEGDGPTQFEDPERLVAGMDQLTLVWEDGSEASCIEGTIDLDAAGEVSDAIIESLADDLDVDRGRVRVVSLEAPNVVSYFLTAPEEDILG